MIASRDGLYAIVVKIKDNSFVTFWEKKGLGVHLRLLIWFFFF